MSKVSPGLIQAIMSTRVTIIHRVEEEPTKYVRAEAWLDGSYLLADAVSKAVNPENFDLELGMQYSEEEARKKAEDLLWQLEGYKLYDQLYRESTTTA